LVGTLFPTASRFNISAKSPQTGILGDSNAGGHLAPEIKYAGYDQIILEGKSPHLLYINIQDSDIEFKDASFLKGLDVYETDKALKNDLSDKSVQTLIAGPAAENGVKFSGVFTNLTRAAARTGMGAILAGKGVKALAVKGTGAIEVFNNNKFEEIVDQINDEIYSHEQYSGRRKMGTTRILKMANTAGFLPTKNYQEGCFEYADEVSGECLAKNFNVKNRGCYACTIPCSRFYTIRQGVFKGLSAEGPEYESQGSFTSRIGNKDLSFALKAIDLCNRLGLDALTTSSCIAWAMELYEKKLLSSSEVDGLDLSWGNQEATLTLIRKIANRESFGDVLADGSRRAAEKIGKGLEYTMQVKNLDLIMADPRGLKGFGLGYSVSSRGGDHLRSEPFIELSDDPEVGKRLFGVPDSTLRLSDKGKGILVSYFEDWCAVIDALEVCKNIMQNMEILTLEKSSKVIETVTGIKITPQQVRDVGERIISIERAFGIREGISRCDDYLPKRFREEKLSVGASSGTVVNQDLMLDEYYQQRGWDPQTGKPTRESLSKLGLGYVSNELIKLGNIKDSS
jgi:aldehyde:ferredoxin oxidoreductase